MHQSALWKSVAVYADSYKFLEGLLLIGVQVGGCPGDGSCVQIG